MINGSNRICHSKLLKTKFPVILILNTYLDYFFLSAVAISLYSAIYSEQQNNVPKWHNKPKKPIKPEFEDDTENEI